MGSHHATVQSAKVLSQTLRSCACACPASANTAPMMLDQIAICLMLILSSIRSLSCRRRLLPDTALLHQLDLAVDHVALVLGMLAGNRLGVEILGVDRLLVDDLRQLGADVLRPVGDLRIGPVVAQSLDVDHAGDEGRAVGIELLADD